MHPACRLLYAWRSSKAGILPQSDTNESYQMKTTNFSSMFICILLSLALFAPLAARLQAATAVTKTTDSGSGSLRTALATATDGDIISISVTGTIKLTTGELVVTNSITIAGPPNPGRLAINGNAASRVFHIGPGFTVSISDLIITNGMATNVFRASAGGGIFNDGSTLMVSNCTISNNAAEFGAGIYNDGEDSGSAELDIMNSTISGNRAGSGGGAIFNNGVNSGGALLNIDSSTLSGNKARFGAGIYNDGEIGDAEMTITSSTLSGNQASSGGGGGVFNNGGNSGLALLTIANSTLSGNKARFGGGIGNDGENFGDAEVTVGNSTLSGNKGGGIYNAAGTNGIATVDIGNTILKRGSGANIRNVSASGNVTSHGFNLTDDSGSGFLTIEAGDLINTNPKLGPLDDYGGPTKTHVLLLGSPAIDQGNANSIGVPASDTDQRGEPRPFDFDTIANSVGGDGSDIGAYEAQCLLADLTGIWSKVAQTCSINSHGQLSCRVKGRLTVRNIGIADAPSSLVNYYLSTDATFDGGDTPLKQATTGIVHPGRPRNRTFSADLPPSVSGSGRFILAVINADSAVAECDEANNVIAFGPLP
jgi:hypothetical protein